MELPELLHGYLDRGGRDLEADIGAQYDADKRSAAARYEAYLRAANETYHRLFFGGSRI